MGSKLTIRSQNDVNGAFIFNFNVNFTYPGVFIVNFEDISHLARRKKWRNTYFILVKRKKSKFNRSQIEVFFLPNINPPYISLPEWRPIRFVVYPYIHTGRINGNFMAVFFSFLIFLRVCFHFLFYFLFCVHEAYCSFFLLYFLSFYLFSSDILEYRFLEYSLSYLFLFQIIPCVNLGPIFGAFLVVLIILVKPFTTSFFFLLIMLFAPAHSLWHVVFITIIIFLYFFRVALIFHLDECF